MRSQINATKFGYWSKFISKLLALASMCKKLLSIIPAIHGSVFNMIVRGHERWLGEFGSPNAYEHPNIYAEICAASPFQSKYNGNFEKWKLVWYGNLRT